MIVRGFKPKVLAAQNDLVDVVGRSDPKRVKMARHVERPENRGAKSLFCCSNASLTL